MLPKASQVVKKVPVKIGARARGRSIQLLPAKSLMEEISGWDNREVNRVMWICAPSSWLRRSGCRDREGPSWVAIGASDLVTWSTALAHLAQVEGQRSHPDSQSGRRPELLNSALDSALQKFKCRKFGRYVTLSLDHCIRKYKGLVVTWISAPSSSFQYAVHKVSLTPASAVRWSQGPMNSSICVHIQPI